GRPAALSGRNGEPAQITLDGKALPPAALVSAPLTGQMTATNAGKKPVWQSVSVTGVLAQAPPAARDGMRISRRFFTLDGKPLDLDQLTQNNTFVLLLEG